jgi:hypothetical protein
MNITRLQFTSNDPIDTIIKYAHASNFTTRIPFGVANCLEIFNQPERKDDLNQFLQSNLLASVHLISEVEFDSVSNLKPIDQEILEMLSKLSINRVKSKKKTKRRGQRSHRAK